MMLAVQSTASIILGDFVAGILLTFTPCVLPMEVPKKRGYLHLLN